METAAPKQRSPWVYVLLGCGGAALLSCLGLFAVFGFGALKLKDSVEGMVDRTKAKKEATKLLGTIPEGYIATGSMNMFGLAQMAQLVKGTELPDGGIDDIEREFMFFVTSGSAKDSNEKSKAFFKGDDSANPTGGPAVRAGDVIKRGNFTVEGRSMFYVVSRGTVEMGQPTMSNDNGQRGPRLNTAVLFDCPGDKLYVGVWSMTDPTPEEPSKTLSLAGTVGDEAQLVPFLKQLTPCGP